MTRRGFSLPEVTIALFILAVGVLVTLQTVATSGRAATTSDAKARAVRDTDALLRRIAHEVSQSTTRIDPSLPPGETQRLWILADGIRFQRVVGYTLDGQGEALQEWSQPVLYRWDEAQRVIVRTPEGGLPRILARNVANFQVGINAAGQVAVSIEIRIGSEARGEEAFHRRTVRITTRNDLR